jgi:hypothetical protein
MQKKYLEDLGVGPNKGGTLVGEILPWIYAPMGATTYTRTIAQQGFIGGTAGAMMDSEAQNLADRMDNARLGALISAGATSVLASPAGIRSFVARQFHKTFATEYARSIDALESEIRLLSGDQSFGFSAGQVSGNPTITSLEFKVRNQAAKLQQNRQLQTLNTIFQKRVDALRKRGSPELVAVDLQKTVEQMDELMRRNATE